MSSAKRQLRKVLYVAMRYDYGKKEQGTSFEFNNFYKTFKRMVPTVVEFDFMTLFQQSGQEAMNRMLLETADQERPDLIVFVLFTDEILKQTIVKLSERFVTFNWFCDDHWRFSNYSRYYAPCFSFVSTTDANVVSKYEKIGYSKALLTQWGCNHYDYAKMNNVPKTYDVTFVGQPHGNREAVVSFLRRQHINVHTFGNGWENGRISQERMIEVFNTSKVNLNLANSSWNIHTFFRRQEQIKGRNFEIPGCGGFLMTNYVNGIEHCYNLGEEIVCFTNKRDLLKKIQFYLHNEEERERIAKHGYERTMREHTYEHRFKELFARIGFTV